MVSYLFGAIRNSGNIGRNLADAGAVGFQTLLCQVASATFSQRRRADTPYLRQQVKLTHLLQEFLNMEVDVCVGKVELRDHSLRLVGKRHGGERSRDWRQYWKWCRVHANQLGRFEDRRRKDKAKQGRRIRVEVGEGEGEEGEEEEEG